MVQGPYWSKYGGVSYEKNLAAYIGTYWTTLYMYIPVKGRLAYVAVGVTFSWVSSVCRPNYVHDCTVRLCLKNKGVMAASSKRSMINTDNVERRQLNNSSVTVSTGDKPPRTTQYFQLKHPVQQNSSVTGRSTQRLTLEHIQAAPSPTGSGGGGRYRATDGGARGKRRSGVVVERGSDSDSRRREERVTFASDTVVQTSDGRAVIVDDSTAGGDGRPSHPRRLPSTTSTLPTRLRGQRRTLPELDQRERADVRKPVQRSQTRPVSAVFDDDGLRFGSSSSPAARTDSVPASMNVLHRGNSTSVARSRDVGVPQIATRRTLDPNYYRDPASARAYRR